MNIRRMIPARLAAFLIMTAALFLASAASQAQVIDCSVCDHFTIKVNANLNCAPTICYKTPSSTRDICRTVQPGDSIEIPCTASHVWVITCSGSYSILPSSSTVTCSPTLKFLAGCCGRICNVPSLDNCTKLEIQPMPCLTPTCP